MAAAGLSGISRVLLPSGIPESPAAAVLTPSTGAGSLTALLTWACYDGPLQSLGKEIQAPR